jgi:Ca2+-binding RTX toxin-like protein
MRAMKRAILITVTVLCVQMGGIAHAAEPSWTILLVGGPGNDSFRVELSPDGRTYEIDSVAPLEVGGSVCWHPEGDALKLLCNAPMIAGFEVNAEGGDDAVEVGPGVFVPMTISGGAGDDRVLAGLGADKLVGGDGGDRLRGGGGDDLITGGSGSDIISGDLGSDELGGEGGQDSVIGGYGDDSLSGGLRHDFLYGGIGNDRLSGGEGRDNLTGGPGDDRYLGPLGDLIFSGPGRDVAIPGGLVR